MLTIFILLKWPYKICSNLKSLLSQNLTETLYTSIHNYEKSNVILFKNFKKNLKNKHVVDYIDFNSFEELKTN